MALHAPAHRQLIGLRDAIHARHVAMTCGAADAGTRVRLMVEADETRQHVYANPGNRLSRVPIAAEFRNFRIVWIDEAMAAHATFDGSDTGKGRPAYAAMTQLAVQLVVTGVYDVTELDRLFGGVRM
jgi:hypothetical protein